MIFPCVHSNRRREPQVANAAPAFISQLSFNVSASSFSSILRITEAKLAKRTLLPADLCSCYHPMPRIAFSRAASRDRAPLPYPPIRMGCRAAGSEHAGYDVRQARGAEAKNPNRMVLTTISREYLHGSKFIKDLYKLVSCYSCLSQYQQQCRALDFLMIRHS